MIHNDLKKGMKVLMTSIQGISSAMRTGTVMDNMKGVTRMVKIDEANGYYPDIGSVYVSDILYALYDNGMQQSIDISEAHQKKLDTLQAINWG